MTRVFNFSPGPATLPEAVLRQAAQEMLDWRGSGMSVMEMSHRGKEFMGIYDETEATLRELMGIPSNYKVLFLQGGGIGENAIVPMNLIGRTGRADYVVSGDWSKKSAQEAAHFGHVRIAASSEVNGKYTRAPAQAEWQLDPKASYVHMCTNETIGGVEYFWTPETGDIPLVADMSSDILSRPMDVSKFGLIYAGAQKNMGPSGMTVVIVRDDLLGHALPITPSVFNYQVQAQAGSMYNTPPTYAIYIAGLVYQHVKAMGGLVAMEAHNRAKAAVLYDFLDASKFFSNPIEPEFRSLMNVPFWLRDESLDEAFLKGSQARGLLQLKGHRSVGGMRASIYNAMSVEGAQALVAYMREFEAAHG
ncbi:MAG TPA: 3-phosphoserine/phosphohydroxythreonine transaminase [Ramlibacter sp.]|nr:3-phosphoserine/phosphohydroxythreonine transaminase [Ramlibacter sp.]